MNALHEEGQTMGTHENAKAVRAPWRRPSLRRMPARDAEVGVDVNTSDGAFTTS
jgi:hypothetical protein